jgi:hypothetical protein
MDDCPSGCKENLYCGIYGCLYCPEGTTREATTEAIPALWYHDCMSSSGLIQRFYLGIILIIF